MCGRYGGPKDLEVYSGHLPIEKPFKIKDLMNEYSIRQMAPIFAKNHDNKVVVQMMRMGLVPPSHTGPADDWEFSTWNARLETVGTTKSFARAWARKRRCIVPASWIGESLRVVDAPGGKVQADFLYRDQRPMGLAGIWEHAQTAGGPLLSFALLTRAPGTKMAQVHPREVCVIDGEFWAPYLAGDDVPLSKPWPDDAWGVRLPERSKRKIAQAPDDLFARGAA